MPVGAVLFRNSVAHARVRSCCWHTASATPQAAIQGVPQRRSMEPTACGALKAVLLAGPPLAWAFTPGCRERRYPHC